MKKWLVLLCIFAFAAPVSAAGLDLGKGTVKTVVLTPGDTAHQGSMLSSGVWDDYDVWVIICDGTGMLEGELNGVFWNETMIAVLYEYQVGLIGYDYGETATFSRDVEGVGAYIVLAGIVSTSGGFPAMYMMDLNFTGYAGECTPPPYNPEKWNDGGTIQYNNNCYNFANDERTDTFAQPGRASGCGHSLTCGTVGPAAECDGLIALSSGSDECPGNMHKVFYVIWPGRDYHWYRQDIPNGMWSHKPGGTAATNRDGSGQLISNPETADTGPYTAHCGYMCACGDDADIR